MRCVFLVLLLLLVAVVVSAESYKVCASLNPIDTNLEIVFTPSDADASVYSIVGSIKELGVPMFGSGIIENDLTIASLYSSVRYNGELIPIFCDLNITLSTLTGTYMLFGGEEFATGTVVVSECQ